MALTQRQQQAAKLIAQDSLTDEQIASSLGVDRRTITRWKQSPHMQVRVRQLVEAEAKRIERSIASLEVSQIEKRIAALDSLWHGILQVKEERGGDPTMAKVPGGSTGLVTRDFKTVGAGTSAKILPVYKVDTSITEQILSIHDSVAEELGQHNEQPLITNQISVVPTDSALLEAVTRALGFVELGNAGSSVVDITPSQTPKPNGSADMPLLP